MTPFQAAEKYIEIGFSVIPIRGMVYAEGDTIEKKMKDAKRPLVKWEAYQERQPGPQELEAWRRRFSEANMGIVTGKASGDLLVLDLDKPEVAKKVLHNLIPDSLEFPICTTPRGGEHWYFKDSSSNARNTVKPEWGFDIRGEGGYVVAPPSAVKGSQGYAWKRGLSVFDVAIPALPRAAVDFLALAVKKRVDSTIIDFEFKGLYRGVDISVDMFTLGRRDNDLFHVANLLVKGGATEQEAYQVLKNIAKSWGEGNDAKWFTDKVRSAFQRSERRTRTLADEVKEYIMSTEGAFSSSDVYAFIGLSTSVHTRQDKKNVSEILRRLIEQEVIERYGNKNGVFRKVENQAEVIDFMTGDDKPVDISWPFDIQELVHTFEKSIVLVAGTSNSGKTAFLLDFVRKNMDKHKINYFSSEMGKAELKSRLTKFEEPMESWLSCKWKERSSNFADVIKADEINIIDFLELHNDFFLVGQMIKDIFDKLRKGIAIIALQKNKDRDHGLGGERSIEKARLYLAMDAGRIKIVKGKNWAKEGQNPNGLEKEFKLVQGCRFIPESGWERVITKDQWNIA